MKTILVLISLMMVLLLSGFPVLLLAEVSAENDNASSLRIPHWISELVFPFITPFGHLTSAAKNAVEPQKELLVLGAGLSRTGTMSTKRALELLGYKVWHGQQLFQHNVMEEYNDAFTNPFSMNAFIDLILSLGYNATLDSPTAVMLPAMRERFPRAKVLLNVRDSPQVFAKSFERVASIFATMYNAPFRFFFRYDNLRNGVRQFIGVEGVSVPCPPESLLWYVPWFRPCIQTTSFTVPTTEMYVIHNRKVREITPSRQLLEFNVKQGWEPLEAFLGVKAPPGESFPNINDEVEMNMFGNVLVFCAIVWPFVVLLFIKLLGRVLIRIGFLP